MNQRKVKSMRSKLGRLAKGCASYKEGGGCHVQRCGLCVVQIETDSPVGNVCPYFMRSVLPADPKLETEYLSYFPQKQQKETEGSRNLKDCARCGDKFRPGSNRARYCKHCRKVAKRQQTVESNRRQRKLG